MIGGLEHHQVIDLCRGHGRGSNVVGHRLLDGASPPLYPRPFGDLRAPATICFSRVGEVGTPATSVTLADDTQCRTVLTHREGVLGARIPRQRSTVTRGRHVPPLLQVIGVRRGREASGDLPSLRPRSRPKYRLPSLSGGGITTASPPLPPGIVGHRRRFAYPPLGVPVRPQQRLRLPLLTVPRARRPWYLAERQQPSRPIALSRQRVCLLFPSL